MPFLAATGSNEPPRAAQRAARHKLREAFRNLGARPGVSRRQRRAGLFRNLKDRPVARPLPQSRARQPRTTRHVSRRSGDDGGGDNDDGAGDGDPEPSRPIAAVPEIQTPIAASAATAEVCPMRGQVIRFPLRAVPAVIVCRERGEEGWLTIVGNHGWVSGSLREARHEARWLSRNTGLPIRELIGGAA